MTRFALRRFTLLLVAALAAPALVAGTIRTVDFESPAPFDRPWEHVWEAYSGYEATVEYGIRKPPIDGYTTSTMYWGGAGICGNCDYGPIRIYFSAPVKNIHFTLYDYFGAYGGPIRWDTREFFSDIPRSTIYLDPYMSTGQTRSITVPGEHVRYLDIDTGHFIALDDFSFEVEDDATIQTFARFETPGTSPTLYATDKTGDVTLNVALGSLVSIGLQQKQGFLEPVLSVPAVYATGSAAPEPSKMLSPTATVMPTVRTAYDGKVLLPLDIAQDATSERFLAVHLGTVSVTITPTLSSKVPAKKVNVSVVKPKLLGVTQNSFDDYFITVAHNTGIPPQYVKGQVRQEADGGKIATGNWRYEPCGADLSYVSGGAQYATTKQEFIDYRLDDHINVTIFPFVADELDPRSRFYIVRPKPDGTLLDRFITDDDRQVSAREIWNDNNKNPNHKHWNFDTGCRKSMLAQINAANSTVLDFTAQTVTGASYGMLQMMWEEGIQNDLWAGVFVPVQGFVKKPKYLFDRPEYIDVGGGSVQAGVNKTVRTFTGKSNTSPNYTTFASYENHLNSAFRWYNHAWFDKATGKYYGDMVIDHSRLYDPNIVTPVFP